MTVWFTSLIKYSSAFARLIALIIAGRTDTSTPAVSVKEIKIAIIVNETLDTFRTGTPTPLPKPGNIETAVYATLAALEPTASLSAEDVEIAAAVSGTVQALLPTAMASASLMRTIDAYRAKITAIASTPAPPLAPPAVPTVLPPAASAVPTAREISDPVGCEDAKPTQIGRASCRERV